MDISLASETIPETSSAAQEHIYDKDFIELAIAECSYPIPDGMARVPWIEDMVVNVGDCYKEEVEIPHIEEAIARETYIQDQAMSSVREAYRRLYQLGVPAARPIDFYAEMLKSDKTMTKIKQNLIHQRKKMEIVERRIERVDNKRDDKKRKSVALRKQHSKLRSGIGMPMANKTPEKGTRKSRAAASMNSKKSNFGNKGKAAKAFKKPKRS